MNTNVQLNEVTDDMDLLDFTVGEQELLKSRRRANTAAAVIVATVTEKAKTSISYEKLAAYTGNATAFVMTMNNLERLTKSGKLNVTEKKGGILHITCPEHSPINHARKLYAKATTNNQLTQ